ncbi:MAG: S8/S53 family peptidase [Pseudomonadota bacterium]
MSLMPEPINSRLKNAMSADLRTREDVLTYMVEHDIPHSTDFYDKTLPDPALRNQFNYTYGLDKLPELNLKEKGASTILVFEHQNIEGYQHGEVNATIAQRVGESLQKGVDTIYAALPINLSYLPQLAEGVKDSVRNLFGKIGIPVFNTSIGWEDSHLSFHQPQLDKEGFRRMTAFLVDSAGNDGMKDYYGNATPGQKHNGASHFPPLVVHVGAAAQVRDKDGHWLGHYNKEGRWIGDWNIESYSSANCPTFVAPVASANKINWHANLPQEISGTSASAPYASGMLATLNARFGAYLTREQMLYAVIATATPIETVAQDNEKPATTKPISYSKTASGLLFNPEYAGFGLVHPHKADRLLAQMVRLTQANPSSITTPVEEIKDLLIPNDTSPPKDADGFYSYTITMPPGLALKTTVAIEFSQDHDAQTPHGKVTLTSPSNTTFPMIMSRLTESKLGTNGVTYWPFSKKDVFGLSTSHAWTGEELAGSWTVRSTTPIRHLQLSQHHFMEKDIIKDLDVKKLSDMPIPDLANAKTIREMREPAATTWAGYVTARSTQPVADRTDFLRPVLSVEERRQGQSQSGFRE